MHEDHGAQAYAVFKKISKKNFMQVTTTQLNVLYNILCRARREEEYKAALAAFDTPEGESIEELIGKYFEGYNARHGVDIRETLTEFTDPSLMEGGYFVLDTFRQDENGALIPHPPTEFEKGETAYVKAVLYSTSLGERLRVPQITVTSLNDDGIADTAQASDTDEILFPLSLSRAGSVKCKVIARNSEGKPILGLDTAFGGVIFSGREICTTHQPPADLRPFWEEQIGRMLAVDPTDEALTPYSGAVVTAFDITEKNFHRITPVDEAYCEKLRENGQSAPRPEALQSHRIWDVHLKAPGPNPATMYVSVPAHAAEHSLPIHFVFDGYGVTQPAPCVFSGEIAVHCSHHGYELGKEDVSYYRVLKEGICANYGRGNGKTNAGYADIRDCYMTYLLLRNLQAIRYCTDPQFSAELPLLHEKWNGELVISGSSMGGYQTICVGALCTILREKSAPFTLTKLDAHVPAFCNIAGPYEDTRIPTYITVYEEGMDYYDAALLASMIRAPFCVQRLALGDETCPATGILAAFNAIPADVPKSVKFLQNSSHGYIPDLPLQKWYTYE